MIWFLVAFIFLIGAAICIRLFLLPPVKKEKYIPEILKESDLYRDGNRLWYMYDGQLYEAVSQHNDTIYIYDTQKDKIIRVPYVQD